MSAIHRRFVDRFVGFSVPSRVSRRWVSHGAPLPSHGWPRFPTVSSTMKALRLPVRAFPIRYGFRFRLHMLLRRSCSPWRSRSGGEPLSGLGALVSRSPSVRRLACGYALDLSGFLAIHPTPLPCSETPAGPTRPRHWRSCRCCPRSQHAEGSSRNMISRLTPGLRCRLPTLHERRCRRPCKARFRLAGCAFAGRELNPLDRTERFQATSILLPRTSPDAS